MSTLRRWAKVIAVNVVLVVLIFYVSHWRFRHSIKTPSVEDRMHMAQATGLAPSLIGSLGKVDVHYPRNMAVGPRIEAGGVRIVALGDSFTLGVEVNPEFSYPTLLSARLAESLGSGVEVLNFGNGWHGAAQTYRLWDQRAKETRPDLVLLGPETCFLEREETFNHAEDQLRDYLHGRYILDGEEIRFIDVVDSLSTDRFDAYYSFLPKWRYLRYDSKPPTVIRGFLPAGRSLQNPFYYSNLTPEAEQEELLRRYVHGILASGAPLVFLQRQRRCLEAVGHATGLATAGFSAPESAIYRTPGGHMSGTGNALVAETFLRVLSGGTLGDPQQVELYSGRANQKINWSGVSRLDLLLDDRVAAVLVPRPETPPYGPAPITNIGAEGTITFLAIVPRYSVFDQLWIPVGFALSDGMEVYLERSGRRELIGRVQLVDGGSLGMVESSRLESPVASWIQTLAISEPATHRETGVTQISLAGTTILEFQQHGFLPNSFLPTQGHFSFFRPEQSVAVDIRTLPPSGELALLLHRPSGNERVVVGSWRKSPFTVEPQMDAATKARLVGLVKPAAHPAAP